MWPHQVDGPNFCVWTHRPDLLSHAVRQTSSLFQGSTWRKHDDESSTASYSFIISHVSSETVDATIITQRRQPSNDELPAACKGERGGGAARGLRSVEATVVGAAFRTGKPLHKGAPLVGGSSSLSAELNRGAEEHHGITVLKSTRIAVSTESARDDHETDRGWAAAVSARGSTELVAGLVKEVSEGPRADTAQPIERGRKNFCHHDDVLGLARSNDILHKITALSRLAGGLNIWKTNKNTTFRWCSYGGR